MQYFAAKSYILDKLRNELSPKLTYHGIHHTLEVLDLVEEIAQLEGGVSEEDLILLKTAALYHDAGFTEGAQEHERQSVIICQDVLPAFAYSEDQVLKISGMIMATKIPQEPQNFLEEIICDADLDYLGREDFYRIGDTLFEELHSYGVLKSRHQWNKIQVSFLESHFYHTKTNLSRRKAQKETYLKEIKKII